MICNMTMRERAWVALHEIETLLQQQENILQRQAIIVVLTQSRLEERDRYVYERIESLLERFATELQFTNDADDTESLKSAQP